MESLSLKYRPRSWDAIVGQPMVQVVLQQMVLKEQVPHALLFDGVRGSGKTTTARILAAALNCESPPGPCTQCPSCLSVYNGSSLDMMEIDAASHGNVDDIRGNHEKGVMGLRERLAYATPGHKHVILLDECHSMSSSGQNALLKTLEEPPPNVVFILLTTEAHKMLETIRSRCMPFTFRQITVSDIVSRLSFICGQEGMDVDRELLMTIAERSNGGLRDAINVLDQVTRVGITTADQFAEHMGEADFAPSLILQMLSGDLVGVFLSIEEQMSKTGDAQAVVNQIVGVFRDVLVLKSGGTIPRQGKALEDRKIVASQLDQAKVFAALRVLWDLKKMRLTTDARTTLDLAAVRIVEVLGKAPTQSIASQPNRKLSLGDLKKMGDNDNPAGPNRST